MAAWVACALCALVIIKPQEFIPALAGLPLVHLAFGAALVAAARDVVWRRVALSLAPQVPFVLAFFGWALLVTAIKRPAAAPEQAVAFAILAGLFVVVAVGCASGAGLRAFAILLVASAALVTAVALEQSRRPFGCFLGAPDDWEGRGELTFDGRPCTSVLDCRKDAPVPDGNYRCERPGPLGTATIGGRVRYRGSLADPNELSLAISMAVPFALALADRRGPAGRGPVQGLRPYAPAGRYPRRESGRAPVFLPPLLDDRLLRGAAGAVRGVPAFALLGAIGVVVVLSQSRSGLLVFLAVLGIHAVRRVGAWGLVVGCMVAPPLLLLGGRSGAEADDSSNERAEILREAFDFIRQTRGVGLGAGQFTDESSIGLTAHNAYVLAAAETGIIGLFLFGLGLYLSLKVPFAIWFSGRDTDPRLARLAPALAVSLCGAALGLVFLSWTYKDILYLIMGASAALYSAARARDPSLRVRLSWSEAALVCLALLGLLTGVYLGARLHR
jgi:hypothetical protein